MFISCHITGSKYRRACSLIILLSNKLLGIMGSLSSSAIESMWSWTIYSIWLYHSIPSVKTSTIMLNYLTGLFWCMIEILKWKVVFNCKIFVYCSMSWDAVRFLVSSTQLRTIIFFLGSFDDFSTCNRMVHVQDKQIQMKLKPVQLYQEWIWPYIYGLIWCL